MLLAFSICSILQIKCMFLIELVTAGMQGKRGLVEGVHLEGLPFGWSFPSAFCAFGLAVVWLWLTGKQPRARVPGRWPGVEQGGDSEGRDSSVPAQCPCPCPAQLGQFQVSKCALAAPFSLQARLFSSTRICHRGFVGYLELRESWA